MSSPENSASHHNADPGGVGAAFNHLAVENNAVFNNFDPNRPDNQPLALIPPELVSPSAGEGAPHYDSALLQEKRTGMLTRLGIFHEPLPPEPGYDFSLSNEDGSTSLWQFYSLNRETDQRKIELVSRYRVNPDETTTVEEVTLLSDHLVELEKAKVKQFTEEGPEGYEVSQRLLGEFHLGGIVLSAFELSPQEKKDMLEAHDDVAKMELDRDEMEAVHMARQEVVAAMMPQTWWRQRRSKKQPSRQAELIAQYEQAVGKLVDSVEDSEAQQQIHKSEQLLRLTELNWQLNQLLRKQEARMRGSTLGAKVVSGVFGGDSHHPDSQTPKFQDQLQQEKLAIDTLWAALSDRRRGDPLPTL